LEVLRAVVENAPLGICLTDRELQILLWNRGAEGITGYLRQEAVGRSGAGDILAHCNEEGQLLRDNRCPLQETIRGASASGTQIYLRHKEGHTLAVRVWTSPIRGENGDILGAVECFEERKLEINEHAQDLAAFGCLDAITELPNAGFTRFHLCEALAAFEQYHLPFGVLRIRVLDLSGFCAAHSSKAGEKLLHTLGQTLKQAMAPDDFVGRWAEDEFLVITPARGAEILRRISEEVQAVMENASISWWGDHLCARVVVHSATVEPQDDLQTLLERTEETGAVKLPLQDGRQCS
jgi:PAS domain S-box-containing protein